MPFMFYVCLLIAVWFTAVNVLRAIAKVSIPPINFIIMSLAIVGCVYFVLEK